MINHVFSWIYSIEEKSLVFCGSDLCFKGENDLSILHENVDHASLTTGVVVGECPQFLASETHACLCAHPTLPTLLPWWLSSKESTCQFRKPGFDPWVGKIPWRRKGNPLQCSCLENPMDRGAWWATVHGVTKSQTRQSG